MTNDACVRSRRLLLCMLLLSACGRRDMPTALMPARSAAFTLTKNIPDNGDGQSGEVGTVLPHTLRVQAMATDSVGAVAPLGGVSVAWTWPGETETIFSSTNANGIAEITLELGKTAGPYAVQARLASHPTAQVTLRVSALPASALSLIKFAGDSQTVRSVYPSISQQFAVTVVDRFGNATQSGKDVRWTVLDGPLVMQASPNLFSLTNSYVAVETLGRVGTGHVRATLATTGAIADFVVFVHSGFIDVDIDDPTGSDTLPVFISRQNQSSPAVDTIVVGTSVRWTNRMFFDNYMRPTPIHRVMSIGSPSFTATDVIPVEGSGLVMFEIPGVYRYGDTYTPRMRGMVVVIPQ